MQADTIYQNDKFSSILSRILVFVRHQWLMTLALFFIFMWTFVPMLWTMSMSLKGIQELFGGGGSMTFFPRDPSLENYIFMIEYLPDIPIYFRNSLIVTLGAVIVQVLCASLMGYAFARLEFRGRDLIFYSLIIAIFVPHAGGLMAQYELMHFLHLRNNLIGLSLLFASNLSVAIFIMRQNFLSLPREIEEAAIIDGAGRWRLFFAVAVPFAASGMLVVAILAFVTVWGEYLVTLTMIDDQKLYTLGVGMAMFDTGGAELMQGDGSVSKEGIRSAGYFLASIPSIVLYLAMQKYFVKGMTEGALKY
jgi:ABC-type glycerol-3-phosphate transport system permease component